MGLWSDAWFRRPVCQIGSLHLRPRPQHKKGRLHLGHTLTALKSTASSATLRAEGHSARVVHLKRYFTIIALKSVKMDWTHRIVRQSETGERALATQIRIVEGKLRLPQDQPRQNSRRTQLPAAGEILLHQRTGGKRMWLSRRNHREG